MIDEFLTYDLTQDPFSTFGGYQPSTIAPINADGLEGSFVSIAITGPTAVSSAVPEPGTWGMMMLGAAATGIALRRQQRVCRQQRVSTDVQFA